MKRKTILSAIAAVVVCCVIPCILMSCDWVPYFGNKASWGVQLIGNYELWHLGNHNSMIVIANEDSSKGETVVPTEVYAVCLNDEYIFVEREQAPPLGITLPGYGSEPHGEFTYYIINATADEVFGPLDSGEFEKKCAELGATLPETWTPVEELRTGDETGSETDEG